MRTSDAYHDKAHSGAHPRDQKCVDDVAGLLLVKGDWNHADPFGKGDHAVKRLVIGSRVSHDLGNVVSPDATGEVERKKPFGPIRELRKYARKKRRRIGCKYRRLGRDDGDRLKEAAIHRHALGYGINYHIGPLDSFHNIQYHPNTA